MGRVKAYSVEEIEVKIAKCESMGMKVIQRGSSLVGGGHTQYWAQVKS